MADPAGQDRPVAGPATGAKLKGALKAALAVHTGAEGVAKPTPPPEPARAPPSGPGGQQLTDEAIQQAETGAHSVGDQNAPSNAGKTAQSSDHWNSY